MLATNGIPHYLSDIESETGAATNEQFVAAQEKIKAANGVDAEFAITGVRVGFTLPGRVAPVFVTWCVKPKASYARWYMLL